MTNILSRGGRWLAGRLSPLLVLIALATVLPITAARAQSLASVPVRYAVVSKTISIGEDYSDPALSTHPSAPSAPKTSISIPPIATALRNPALLQDQGNTLGATQAVYQVGAGRNGELTVFISGAGATITLPDIQQSLAVISPTVPLIENQGNGIWQANASLFLNRGVTLTLTPDTVTWLKLRSQSTNIQLSAAEAAASYNYDSFVALRTHSGAILIDGVKITSWDPANNDYDRDISNGRAYVIAKYDARMDIKNADLSYLGSADDESYGVAWRDSNDFEAPDTLLTRVTGQVLNSNFSYNYYGMYAYQARDMIFRGNQFHNNIGYGFDPHDFSHHFTIEDNQAFANGNHGFIISRGVNNFVFRRNKS